MDDDLILDPLFNLPHTLHNDEEQQPNQPLNPTQQPQEQHLQTYTLTSIQQSITIRQLPFQGLSFQLWPAATSLLNLLNLTPSLLHLPPSPKILELGSGTGLVGIAAASLLPAHVTLTDLPHVLPNLLFNASLNSDIVNSRGGSVDVRQLRWGDDGDCGAFGDGEFDAVIASDVVYYEHLIEPLLRTLRVFVKGEVGFVMAHLRRWKKRDAVFFKKARKVFDVEVVHSDPPLPGSRVGVVVYRFTAKQKKGADKESDVVAKLADVQLNGSIDSSE